MRKYIASLMILAAGLTPAMAQSAETVETFHRSPSQQGVKVSSDALFVAMPVVAIGATVLQQDWEGLKQVAFTGAATVGASLILKFTIHKQRPDYSNFHSFPSLHTATGFASAAFIQRRYGWKYGAPAYALATYIGWARTYSKKHDVWDVLAGAAIGAGTAYIFTRPFARKHDLQISPISDGKTFAVSCSFKF